MSLFKISFLTISSLGTIAGSAAGINFWLSSEKTDTSKAKKETPKGNIVSKEYVWRYVLTGAEEGQVCDFLEKGEPKSQKRKIKEDFLEASIDCQSVFSDRKIDVGKKGFWISGQQDEVDKLLKSDQLELSEFQKEDLEISTENRKGIESLGVNCQKTLEEKSNQKEITIVCK